MSATDSKSLIITWEREAADRIRKRREQHDAGRTLMVSLVGFPGAGKSTSAKILHELIGLEDCFVVAHVRASS